MLLQNFKYFVYLLHIEEDSRFTQIAEDAYKLFTFYLPFMEI